MKKKISMLALCGVMLLGLCGCGVTDNKGVTDDKKETKNTNDTTFNDLIGTWQLQTSESRIIKVDGYSGELEEQLKLTEENLKKLGWCVPCNKYLYDDERETIQYYDTFLCFDLVDKETLKQVSCDFSFKVGMPWLQEKRDITYKKIK